MRLHYPSMRAPESMPCMHAHYIITFLACIASSSCRVHNPYMPTLLAVTCHLASVFLRLTRLMYFVFLVSCLYGIKNLTHPFYATKN